MGLGQLRYQVFPESYRKPVKKCIKTENNYAILYQTDIYDYKVSVMQLNVESFVSGY